MFTDPGGLIVLGAILMCGVVAITGALLVLLVKGATKDFLDD